jgi:type IX secretion system substrate protein
MKKVYLLVPVALAASLCVQAQSIGPSTLNSVGNSAPIGGNVFDWSVGEMTMVSTFTTSSIIITQGLLQPAHIAAENVGNVQPLSGLKVFPNPASSVVNIQYVSPGQGTLSFRLVDLAGKVISNQTAAVTGGTNLETVNVTDLACATYMLEVTVNNGNASSESTSYKIQKLK